MELNEALDRLNRAGCLVEKSLTANCLGSCIMELLSVMLMQF